MGKRLFCLLMAVMLLLCGCGNDVTATTGTDTTVDSTDAAVTIDYHENVMAQVYEVPTYDAEPLISNDSDRQVYISLSNQDCDFYPDCWFNGVMFWVITREHYDPSQIQVHVDSQTEYEVTVMDNSDDCGKPSYSAKTKAHGLSEYQYMCMQELDWGELAEKAIYAVSAEKLSDQYPRNSEEYAGYRALTADYSALMESYREQYEALTQADIPQFSAYRVIVKFTGLGSHEETVETVMVELGREVYTLDIGQWRLHNTLPQTILEGATVDVGVKQRPAAVVANADCVYYDGYHSIPGLFNFTAKENLSLTGIHQLETAGQPLKVIGARINVYDEEWEQVVTEYFWDPSQTLDIVEGTNVKIDVYVYDERFKTYESCFTAYFFLDYTVRNKEYAMATPCRLNRIHEAVWDTYLMAFEGIDMGEYYTVYYAAIVNDWRRDLPEGWLN